MHWSKAIDDFRVEMERRNLKPATIRDRCRYASGFAEYFKKLGVSPDEAYLRLSEYQGHLLERGLATSTINLYMKSIKLFYADGIGITSDFVPVEGAGYLPRPVPKPILDTLLAKSSGVMLSYCLLGSHAGLRVSEMANLEFEDLDFTECTIRVFGKGDKERIVPMHRLLELALSTDPPWVHDYSGHYLSSLISKHMAANGAEGYSAHNLRHSFGTNLYQATRDIFITSKLMGHASVDTTQVYAEMDDQSKRDAVAKL